MKKGCWIVKKSTITIPLLVAATALTIVFGRRYAAERQEGMDKQLLVAGSERQEEGDNLSDHTTEANSDSEMNENRLEEYKGRVDSLSIYERMDYLSLLNGQASLAFYGDIDLDEEWALTFIDRVTAQTNNLVVLDHTYPRYDTYQLYIEQTALEVTSDNPDIIIYGLPALADKVRDIGLSETEEFMTSILNSIAASENTELYLLEPYPIINEINQLNSRSLDYRSYLNRMREVAETRGIPVLPLHSAFVEESNSEDVALYFEEGTTELNKAGVEHVTTLLDDQFNQPR